MSICVEFVSSHVIKWTDGRQLVQCRLEWQCPFKQGGARFNRGCLTFSLFQTNKKGMSETIKKGLEPYSYIM